MKICKQVHKARDTEVTKTNIYIKLQHFEKVGRFLRSSIYKLWNKNMYNFSFIIWKIRKYLYKTKIYKCLNDLISHLQKKKKKACSLFLEIVLPAAHFLASCHQSFWSLYGRNPIEKNQPHSSQLKDIVISYMFHIIAPIL